MTRNKDLILQTKPLACDSPTINQDLISAQNSINEEMPMIQLGEHLLLWVINHFMNLLSFVYSHYTHFPFQIRDREKETDIDVNLCILLCMVLWGSEETAWLRLPVEIHIHWWTKTKKWSHFYFHFLLQKISLPVSLACVGASMSRSLTLEKTACINML